MGNIYIVNVVLYPLKGIWYFIIHKQCWSSFTYHLGPLLLATLLVYGIIFGVFMIGIFISGGSLSLLFPTVLQSCNFIVNIINKSILLPKTLNRLFDDVVNTKMKLEYNKLPRGVLKAYLPGYYGETITGKLVRYLLTSVGPLLWLLNLILLFFINLIPVVGPLLVIVMKAPGSAFGKHRRYFHLKGFSNAQIHYIWLNNHQFYFAFGVVALLMESIPFVSMFFIFTNDIGAALWAIDVEKQMTENLLKVLSNRNTKDYEAEK